MAACRIASSIAGQNRAKSPRPAMAKSPKAGNSPYLTTFDAAPLAETSSASTDDAWRQFAEERRSCMSARTNHSDGESARRKDKEKRRAEEEEERRAAAAAEPGGAGCCVVS